MSIREAPLPGRVEDEVETGSGPAEGPAAGRARPAPQPRQGRRGSVIYDDQAARPKAGDALPPVEVRRVRRVLRRIDAWSLFRFALCLYACALLVFLAAAVGLWIVASTAGAIPSIENFIAQLFALKTFHFVALQLLAGLLGIGIVGVLVTTLFTVVTAVLYNLISDVVGGIEVTVLEEEPVRTRG